MNSSNDNEKLNKHNYLIQNIFISENNSQSNNVISLKNTFNFSIKQVNISSNALDLINRTDEITLFHKKYKKEEKQKLINKFNKLIYFCYRSNTFPMYNKLNSILTRDSGWGCMIRCGQMIMARAVYKYLKSKNFSSEKAILETIKYFLDIQKKIFLQFFLPFYQKILI